MSGRPARRALPRAASGHHSESSSCPQLPWILLPRAAPGTRASLCPAGGAMPSVPAAPRRQHGAFGQLRVAPFYTDPPDFACAVRWAGLTARGLLAAPHGLRPWSARAPSPLPLTGTAPTGVLQGLARGSFQPCPGTAGPGRCQEHSPGLVPGQGLVQPPPRLNHYGLSTSKLNCVIGRINANWYFSNCGAASMASFGLSLLAPVRAPCAPPGRPQDSTPTL